MIKVRGVFHVNALIYNVNIGYHNAIKEVFQLIGGMFSSMAVALVAGLEGFYKCPDSSVRAICVTCLASLINQNKDVFLGEDQHILLYILEMFPYML